MTPKLLYLYNEIEIVRMKAKMMEVGNSDRLHRGASIKYEEKHFEDLIRRLLVVRDEFVAVYDIKEI